MRYRTIVADPPWPYRRFAPSKTGALTWRTDDPYPMMSLDDVRALRVSDLADDWCRLFLWTTTRFLRDAFGVLEEWGWVYKQTLIWRKTGNPSPFTNNVAPQDAEFLLVGNLGPVPRASGFPSSVLDFPKGRHSEKPAAILDLIERVSPGPYLELFARRQRLGWDTWGNEALEHVSLSDGLR